MIVDPVTLTEDAIVGDAISLMRRFKIGGIPIIDGTNKLTGILTNRDLRFETQLNRPVKELMTSLNLVTAPVGTNLEQARDIMSYGKLSGAVGTFANNDMDYVDATGIDHDRFSYGLKKSLLNFMHGIGFDFPLQDWFDFPIPETSIPQDYIQDALHEEEPFKWRTNAKVVWLGGPVSGRPIPRLSKKDDREGMELTVHDLHETYSVKLPKELGQWLIHLIPRISGDQKECLILGDIASDADAAGLADLELLWEGREMRKLRERGLVVV